MGPDRDERHSGIRRLAPDAARPEGSRRGPTARRAGHGPGPEALEQPVRLEKDAARRRVEDAA